MKNVIKVLSVLIFLFSFSIFHTELVNGSSGVEICSLKTTVLKVSDDFIQIKVNKIDILDKNNSAFCAEIKVNSEYQIKVDNFLRNAYKSNVFVGQTFVIRGNLFDSMGSNGVQSGGSWELNSAGRKILSLPISIEKVKGNASLNQTEDKTLKDKELTEQRQSASEDNTVQVPKKSAISRVWLWFLDFFR